MRILATCSSLSVFCCFSPPRSKFYLCLSWCWKLIPPCLKGGRLRVFLVHFSLYWCVLLNHTWNFNLHFNKAEFVFRWCGAHSGGERGLPILYYHEGTFYITAVLATTSKILFQFNQNKLTLRFSSEIGPHGCSNYKRADWNVWQARRASSCQPFLWSFRWQIRRRDSPSNCASNYSHLAGIRQHCVISSPYEITQFGGKLDILGEVGVGEVCFPAHSSQSS